jgi:hypothetical protein
MLYLSDAGLSSCITTVTSVSGGSFLNAFLALQERPFTVIPASEFDVGAARLANLLSGNPRRWWLTVRLALVLLVVLVLLWLTILNTWAFLTASAATLVAVAVCLGPGSGGFLFGYWFTWLYLASVMWMGLVVIAWVAERAATVSWCAALSLGLVWTSSVPAAGFLWGAALLVLVAVLAVLVQQRHRVAGLAFGHAMAGLCNRKQTVKLTEMRADGIRHILCATELHAGEHAYFSHDLVYSHGFGHGHPGDLPLRTAVQLSANFPPGFPPRILHAAQFQFKCSDLKEPGSPSDSEVSLAANPPQWMVLSDGGVYDNTADSWYLESGEREARLRHEHDKELGPRLREERAPDEELVDYVRRISTTEFRDRDPWASARRRLKPYEEITRVIVVNAGKAEPWRSLRSVWIPLFGELTSFGKITSTMYNNGVRSRIRDIGVRFARGERDGAVVDMSADPHTRAREASEARPFGAPQS